MSEPSSQTPEVGGTGPSIPTVDTRSEVVSIAGKLDIRPSPPCTRLILRGREAARLAAGAALGLEVPREACRSARNDDGVAVLWLGPDEWLMLVPAAQRDQVLGLVDTALTGGSSGRLSHSLVDISDRQIATQIRGPLCTDVLATGCPLDLDIGSFAPGSCTRTVFGKAEIVLWRTEEMAFRVEVQRSFAEYCHALMVAAAKSLI